MRNFIVSLVSRLIAFCMALAIVYYIWGSIFKPGGTGSNVVLGLLVALGGIVLITTKVGSLLDDYAFSGHLRIQRTESAYAQTLVDEVDELLKRIHKGKMKAEGGANAVTALQSANEELKKQKSAIDLQTQNNTASSEETIKTFAAAISAVEQSANRVLGPAKATSWIKNIISLLLAFSAALSLREFLFEPFQIPSSSMIPTLLIGDHLFVYRAAYGLQKPFANRQKPEYLTRWGSPQPGDVVVFVAPPYVGMNAGEDWIKRVIAVAGQKVYLKDSVLYVDDKPYAHSDIGLEEKYYDYNEMCRAASGCWQENRAIRREETVLRPDGSTKPHSIYLSEGTMMGWPFDGNQPIQQAQGLTCNDEYCIVKDGYIFVMGDNRDHSSDGRRWGAVPVDNVKGRATSIWMSVNGAKPLVEWGRFTLPEFRFDRMFTSIK